MNFITNNSQILINKLYYNILKSFQLPTYIKKK